MTKEELRQLASQFAEGMSRNLEHNQANSGALDEDAFRRSLNVEPYQPKGKEGEAPPQVRPSPFRKP